MRTITRGYFKWDREIFHMDYECVDWDSIEEAWKVFGFKFLYCTQITNDNKEAETKDNQTWMIQETTEN